MVIMKFSTMPVTVIFLQRGRAGRVADALLGQRDGTPAARPTPPCHFPEHEAVAVQLHRMMADAGVGATNAVERCRISGDQLHALVLPSGPPASMFNEA